MISWLGLPNCGPGKKYPHLFDFDSRTGATEAAEASKYTDEKWRMDCALDGGAAIGTVVADGDGGVKRTNEMKCQASAYR